MQDKIKTPIVLKDYLGHVTFGTYIGILFFSIVLIIFGSFVKSSSYGSVPLGIFFIVSGICLIVGNTIYQIIRIKYRNVPRLILEEDCLKYRRLRKGENLRVIPYSDIDHYTFLKIFDHSISGFITFELDLKIILKSGESIPLDLYTRNEGTHELSATELSNIMTQLLKDYRERTGETGPKHYPEILW